MLKFNVLFLVSISAIAVSSHADENADKALANAEAVQTQAKNDYKTLAAQLNKDSGQYTKLTKDIEDSGWKWDDNKQTWITTCGGLFNYAGRCLSDVEKADLAAKLSTERAQVATLAPKIQADEKLLDAADHALDQADGKALTAQRIKGTADQASTAIVNQLHTRINNLKLQDDFKSLRIDTLSLSQSLNAMEEKLKGSIMATYFQDKIGQLLNSDVFCSAVKNRCGTPKDKAVPIGDDQLESLFPGMKDSRRSKKESWDMQHATPATAK